MQFGKFDALLSKLGICKVVDEGKGSHIKYENLTAGRFTILSKRYSGSHTTDIPRHILTKSLRQLRLNEVQLAALLQLLS